MKRLLFLTLILIPTLLMGCSEQEVYLFSYFKGNGEDGLHLAKSEDGRNWTSLKGDASFLKPELSSDKLMRDPCIIIGGDGLFHMVWTVSWTEKGIGYASSKDLITWSEQKFIPVMAHEEGVRNCWAPEITYDKKSGTYMIYWATTIDGRFTETVEPKESNLSHRMYATTTKDFKTFSPTFLLYDHGFSVIDSTIIPDGDRFVMFLKDETRSPVAQKNIRVSYAEKLEGPYSAPSEPITGKYWAEGPTVLREADGSWVVYFDKYSEGKYGAVRSSDLQSWEDISSEISIPKGLRHGTIFKVKRSVVDKIEAL